MDFGHGLPCSRTRFNSAVLLSLVSPSELDATHLEFMAFLPVFTGAFFGKTKKQIRIHRPFWRLCSIFELLVECEVKLIPRAVFHKAAAFGSQDMKQWSEMAYAM